MNGNRVFLDTNILIYAYDTSAGKKNRVAKDILIGLWNSGKGILSTQVIQEFFVNITGKIQKPVDVNSAEIIVKDLLQWDIFVNDEDSILKAIEICKGHSFSFWDAMILQAAVRGGAERLYTEDMTHGQVVEGVRLINPFF